MPTLDWLDRAQALTAADRVPHRVLEPLSEHGDGNPENLLIQGDNLDALKALLPFYRARVKCIFIDPPYNTRSAFEHYDDNLEHSQWLSGRWEFRKHYYPVIADLKAFGEEFDCARLIDRHPAVKQWVRNLDNPQFGFWLPTSRGRFYPDFVAELHDGRLAIIEYKGEHLRNDPYEVEKRQVGELWAARIAQGCIFRFVYREDQGRSMEAQVDAALS